MTRAIHTHAACTMSDANGGLVSIPSDREMQGPRRGSSAHAAATDPNAWELSWSEPHADKRDIGQLSNRKLIEPPASGYRIPAYVDKITGNPRVHDPKKQSPVSSMKPNSLKAN